MLSIRNSMRTLLVLASTGFALVAGSAVADPPARVARLAYIQGQVSFAPAGEDEWVVATPNRPLIAGDRIWSDAAARTEVQVGSAAIRLGATTSATVLNLDDRIAQFEVTQGTVYVNARRLAPEEVVEIDTPNLALTIRRPGTYRIDVDTSGDSTAVGVRRGEAEVYGEGAAYVVGSGQWYRFYATGLEQRQYAALPPPDEFDQWAVSRDRRYDTVAAARYVAPEVIGYEDLDQYGTWSAVPEYGNVWTPNRVAADWAPYRDGRWSWIEPWGWTWVDAEPWGFAPYHYGRWAYARDRWCWVPGPRTARPVYAPALVAFVGDPNFGVSISAGPSVPIAWFPLAPGEVYRPAYRVSRDYFTRVNVTNTRINTTIVNNYYNNNVTNVIYRNRQAPRAITAVPSEVFVQSRLVAPVAGTVATVDLAKLQVTPVPPVGPSRASVLAAPPAQHRPAEQVLSREVFAKTKPAPMPLPFQVREPALAKQAGRPLDSNVVASTATGRRADERRVRLVTATARPEPAPKGPDTAGTGKGQPRVATQDGVPAPGIPNQQEAGKAREEAQRATRQQQQEQQRAQQQATRQQQEQQRAQQSARQQPEQQQERERAQQSARQQREQQRAQQQATRQQQEQQRVQQQATPQQQEQQRAQQQAARQQQEQQRAQQQAARQQQEQQRAQQQAARQQQQEQQRAQQQAARQQQEQQRVQQQAARQQQEQQRAQQQAARQQQEQQRAQQQAARQQQEQQRAQQQAGRQQQEQQRAQQQAARQQQEQQRARQAPPPKDKDEKRDDDKQAKT